MISCPSCNHKERIGTLFCSQCGAQLVFAGRKSPTKRVSKIDLKTSRPSQSSMIPPKYMDADLILYVISNQEFIPLSGKKKFSLGRASEEPVFRPDVDLTPYQAYEMGVSRLHALIEITESKVSLTDLDSVNGTQINNKHVLPKIQHSLQNGDNISMGKLKLRVIIPK